MKKILITGGAGFVGSHTALLFLERGYDVDILDSFCNSHIETVKKIEYLKKIYNFKNSLKIIKGDIRDKKILESIFSNAISKNNPIHAVIHFAGLKSVAESVKYPDKYWDFNVNGSLNLFNIMDKFECRNIVFSSSATVYKTNNNFELLKENSEIKPTNPYGQTKAEVEKLLLDINRKFNELWKIVILRYFNPIGCHPSGLLGEDPFGIPNNLFPLILKVSSREIPNLKIFGNDWPTHDGTPLRDYIHVMDLAEAHEIALSDLLKNQSKLSILNIGTGVGTSVLELLETFKSVNNIDLPYIIAERREGDVPFLVADNSLALKKLNWFPRRTIRDMCRDGWKWKKMNAINS